MSHRVAAVPIRVNDVIVYTMADNLWILNASSKVFSRLSQRFSTFDVLLLAFEAAISSMVSPASAMVARGESSSVDEDEENKTVVLS